MGGRRKPVRNRKARWAERGQCPQCPDPILIGQRVISVSGGPWMHVGHLAGRGGRSGYVAVSRDVLAELAAGRD